MSNWASITSADFATGAYFHQPIVTDVHPALRNQSVSSRSRSSTTEQVPESSTASESGSYYGPDTPSTVDDISNLRLDGGADKMSTPIDVEGSGLIPLREESNEKQQYNSSGGQNPSRSPPKTRYTLFPPESNSQRIRPLVLQRKPSDTSSHTSGSDSAELSQKGPLDLVYRNPHARSMSHDGQWVIQPDNLYGFSRAQASSSPPPPNYYISAPTSHPDQQITLHSNSFSPGSSGSDWEMPVHKSKTGRSMSLPVPSFKKFLKKGSTPLIEAAKMGDYNELLRLLAPGPQTHPISGADRDGFTPLHHAVRLGYLEIARALVLRHAALEARTKAQDRTPLWFAVHAGHANIVEMLLEHKANANSVSKMDGATPLHKASQQGNEEIMQLLIKAGADVNLRDVEGMPPLMWATQSKRIGAARLLISQGACLETRIKLGANLELASREGLTVLQKAINTSDHATAHLFLEMGANPNCWGPNGMKPLHKAASRGDLNMCIMLIDAGAEVGTRTLDGWTALHFAARYGHEDVADLLIKKGCEPLIITSKGETAKQIAEKYGYHNIV